MSRQIWNKPLNYQYSVMLRDNPYFLSPPSSSSIIPDLDAPVNVGENYGQRLVAYYHVCWHTFHEVAKCCGLTFHVTGTGYPGEGAREWEGGRKEGGQEARRV